MTTAITADHVGRAILPALPREHQEVLRKRIAPGASDAEIELFLMQARATGLDPFAMPPEIWLIPRRVQIDGQWVKQHVPQIGRDGLLVLAKRTGRYLTHTTEYRGADGVWTDDWLDEEHPPAACRVTIPIVGTQATIRFIARYREFVQYAGDGKVTQLWQKMPTHMLEKAGLTHALKRLPGADFGTIEVADEEYDSEGMSQRAFWAWAGEQGITEPIVRRSLNLLDGESLGAAVDRMGGWNHVRPYVEAKAESLRSLPEPGRNATASDLYQHDPDPVATARNRQAAQQRTMSAEGPGAPDFAGDPPAPEPADEPDDPASIGVCSEEGCTEPATCYGPDAVSVYCDRHGRQVEQAEPDPLPPCPPTVNDLGSFLDAIEALGADRSDLPALGALPKRGAAHEEWVAMWDRLAARKRTPQRAMPLGEA